MRLWRRRAGNRGASPCRDDRLVGRARSRAGSRPRTLTGLPARPAGLIGGVLVGLVAGKGAGAGLGQTYRRQPSRGPRADRAPDRRCQFSVSAPACLGRAHAIARVLDVGDYIGSARPSTTPSARLSKGREILGLPFPGGPRWSGGAGRRPGAFRPSAADDGPAECYFSLSGLKTAVRLGGGIGTPITPWRLLPSLRLVSVGGSGCAGRSHAHGSAASLS